MLLDVNINHFYRAMHFSAKRGIAIACPRCVDKSPLSVCLSVCLSVTLVDCVSDGAIFSTRRTLLNE